MSKIKDFFGIKSPSKLMETEGRLVNESTLVRLYFGSLILLAVALILLTLSNIYWAANAPEVEDVVVEDSEVSATRPQYDNAKTYIPAKAVIKLEPDISEKSVADGVVEPDEAIQMPEEDIALIALVTMAEAEGECEEGKRLVIDTILNRVDSEHFPDTVYDVIYQKSQFSSMWNGRVDRCEVRDDIYRLVLEELETRTNRDVVFFRTKMYSKYGVPMFQVESHYFSSYKKEEST